MRCPQSLCPALSGALVSFLCSGLARNGDGPACECIRATATIPRLHRSIPGKTFSCATSCTSKQHAVSCRWLHRCWKCPHVRKVVSEKNFCDKRRWSLQQFLLSRLRALLSLHALQRCNRLQQHSYSEPILNARGRSHSPKQSPKLWPAVTLHTFGVFIVQRAAGCEQFFVVACGKNQNG